MNFWQSASVFEIKRRICRQKSENGRTVFLQNVGVEEVVLGSFVEIIQEKKCFS